MTLQGAIIAARRRTLRPEAYQQAAGAFFAFLMIVVAVRLAANVYVGHLLLAMNPGAGTAPSDGSSPTVLARFFARTNLSWCGLFLTSVAPIIAYRGIAQTVRSTRMRLAPLPAGQLLVAAIGTSLRSFPVFLPVVLSIGIEVLYLQPAAVASLIDLLFFLLADIVGYLWVFLVAWYIRAEGRRLELVEIGIYAAMIFANPELRIISGDPHVLFFVNLKISETRAGALLALPLLGAAATCAVLFLTEIASGARVKRSTRKRHPGIVLYRSHIPMRLFVLTYAVEVPVVLTNPAVATTVRNIVLFLLCARVAWFLLFVFRTEQEIGQVLRIPWKLSDRIPFYRPAAGVHALLCAVPVLLYIGRVVVR